MPSDYTNLCCYSEDHVTTKRMTIGEFHLLISHVMSKLWIKEFDVVSSFEISPAERNKIIKISGTLNSRRALVNVIRRCGRSFEWVR